MSILRSLLDDRGHAPPWNDGHWIQAVPGKGWFCVLRLYGPTEAWDDKSWRPGAIELVR